MRARSLSSSRFTLCAALLASAAGLGGAHVAFAQGGGSKPPPKAPAAPSATSTGAPAPELIEGSEELQKLYMEGDAALKRGDYAAADAIFTKAWGLSRSFDIAAALGTTKLEEGKHRDAAQYLSFALRNALPSTKATQRERIKRDLDAARQKLATVKLTASIVEARIAIDGAPLDPLFFGPEIFVDPGKHTFEASADGHLTAKQTVDTSAGQIYVVTLTLERKPPPGVPTTTAPPPPPPTPLLAKVLGAGGGVAVTVGAIFIGIAEARKQDASEIARKTLTGDGKPTCPIQGPGPTDRCDQLRAAAGDTDIFGNAGIGVLVGGGALLLSAGAISLFFMPKEPPRQPAPTSRVVPVIGPSSGGLVWSGSF